MVITSHILAEIQERVDRLAIMAAGKVQATGTVQALREQMDLPLWFDDRAGAEDFSRRCSNALGAPRAIEASTAPARRLMRVPRTIKMPGDGRHLGDTVRDLTVREPSLEDVFFGFSD